MAKCAFCGKRKGKRPCPALGAICSACCGQHRQREIACPSHCAFLPSAGSRSAMNTAGAKLDRYTMTEPSELGKRAADAWFEGTPPGERTLYHWEESSFVGYLELGFEDEHGRRVVDLFLGDPRSDLTAAERAAVVALRDVAWATYAEILDVRLDVGIEILDLVSGETLFVHEKRGTHGLQEGDALLVWLVPLDGHYELPGAITRVAPAHVEIVEAAVDEALDRAPEPTTVAEEAHGSATRFRPSISRFDTPSSTGSRPPISRTARR